MTIMVFGSWKSEWSDRLARALALVPCERHIAYSDGEVTGCGFPGREDPPCPPCSARQYVARYPGGAGDGPEAQAVRS